MVSTAEVRLSTSISANILLVENEERKSNAEGRCCDGSITIFTAIFDDFLVRPNLVDGEENASVNEVKRRKAATAVFTNDVMVEDISFPKQLISLICKLDVRVRREKL